MTERRPATAATDAIVRPSCIKCGTRTFLAGIEPDKPGYELCTFECPRCGQFETSVIPAGAL